ncbi:hypothetical protein [Nocardia abscessus]|uniref:hypothetical protein n=1 Tax=Nocardia abscessus TaxID=120957 RepID=UPI002453F180|nr:hypothetical protein [Nocardia abscessus]
MLIRLALIPREPCGLFIRTDDVRAEDLTVRMRARDLTSQVVGRLGRVESVVAEHILRYIDDLFAGPEFSGVRDIDIAHIIERAWVRGSFSTSPTEPRADPPFCGVLGYPGMRATSE